MTTLFSDLFSIAWLANLPLSGFISCVVGPGSNPVQSMFYSSLAGYILEVGILLGPSHVEMALWLDKVGRGNLAKPSKHNF